MPLELSDDDKAPSVAASYEQTINTPNDTIVVNTGTQDHVTLEDSQKHQYPITPKLTPKPTNSLGIANEQAVTS